MKNIAYITYGLSIIASACMVAGCMKSTAREEVESRATESAPQTETFILRKEKFETNLRLPGELVAFQQVDLYAKVTGFVKTLQVDIGSVVRRGQVLVTLEAPELNSQRAAAASRLKSQEAIYTASNANYKRLLETSKTPGTISQNDLDVASAKRDSDYANLEAARASYKEINDISQYLVIRAPFDGVITSRNVNIGALVGPAGKGSETPLLILQEQQKLRLVVSVPEAYTRYLTEGDEVTFSVRYLPATLFKAKVARMAGALDLRLRAERIELDVINTARKLLPGTVAEVMLPLSRQDSSFVIPKTSLISSGEGQFVIKVVDNKAVWVEVKKGLDVEQRVEVFGQLNPGDQLVTKASEEIRSGSTLTANVSQALQR